MNGLQVFHGTLALGNAVILGYNIESGRPIAIWCNVVALVCNALCVYVYSEAKA